METFRVEELAAYLKLHEYTIRRLAREGKIPYLYTCRQKADQKMIYNEGI